MLAIARGFDQGDGVLAMIAIASVDLLQRIFDTTGLSFNQRSICVGIASSSSWSMSSSSSSSAAGEI